MVVGHRSISSFMDSSLALTVMPLGTDRRAGEAEMGSGKRGFTRNSSRRQGSQAEARIFLETFVWETISAYQAFGVECFNRGCWEFYCLFREGGDWAERSVVRSLSTLPLPVLYLVLRNPRIRVMRLWEAHIMQCKDNTQTPVYSVWAAANLTQLN